MAKNHMEWQHEPMATRQVPVTPVRIHWDCPMPGCTGEMIATGSLWPISPPGYHHKCSVCGEQRATMRGKFPTIEYIAKPDAPGKCQPYRPSR